jgi:hypothetical protein
MGDETKPPGNEQQPDSTGAPPPPPSPPPPPQDDDDGPILGPDDLAAPRTVSSPDSLDPRTIKPTIPEKQEDARRFLALWLVAIFGFEVFAAMAALLLCKPAQISDVKELLTVILSPTVALVGSATGFYFGTNPSHGSPPSGPAGPPSA